MRITLLAICFVGLLLSNTATADLAWSSREHTLEAKAGAPRVATEYAFINNGDEPVTIGRIDTSCGCTAAAPDKKVYEPGESGAIKATFELGDRRGEQRKLIVVHHTRKGSEPSRSTLTMRVSIAEPVVIQPRFLVWEPGEAREAKTLTVVSQKPAVITSVYLNLPVVDVGVRLKPSDEIPASEAPDFQFIEMDEEGQPVQVASEVESDDNLPLPFKGKHFQFRVAPKGDEATGRVVVRVDIELADGSETTLSALVRMMPDSNEGGS